MVYLPRYGWSQTHYLKYRLRLTHRKRKKWYWICFKPPPLLLKIGYFWSIKSQWGEVKKLLNDKLFGLRTTRHSCVLLNVSKVGHPTCTWKCWIYHIIKLRSQKTFLKKIFLKKVLLQIKRIERKPLPYILTRLPVVPEDCSVYVLVELKT